MSVLVMGIVLVTVTVAAEAYLRRAAASYENAGKVWDELYARAAAFVGDEAVPPPLAKMAYGLGAVAGCGCFVRAMLLAHYFPRLLRKQSKAPDGRTFGAEVSDALSRLPQPQRDRFHELIAYVIVYDGFANPLQGLLFRRIIRKLSPKAGTPPKQYIREAKDAALSVMATRGIHAPV